MGMFILMDLACLQLSFKKKKSNSQQHSVSRNMNETRPSLNITSSCSPSQDSLSLTCALQGLRQLTLASDISSRLGVLHEFTAWAVRTILSPFLRTKLRLKEVNPFDQDCSAGKWQNQNPNTGCLTLVSTLQNTASIKYIFFKIISFADYKSYT